MLSVRLVPRLKHVWVCFLSFFFTDSLQTLIYEWFTVKRNALWISLLFNLSKRPLKTGSNALISYSEERLIYRYACHLLLPIFTNKSLYIVIDVWIKVALLYIFLMTLVFQGNSLSDRNISATMKIIMVLWGNIFLHVRVGHKGSSTAVNKAMRNVLSGGCKEWRTAGYYVDKVFILIIREWLPPLLLPHSPLRLEQDSLCSAPGCHVWYIHPGGSVWTLLHSEHLSNVKKRQESSSRWLDANPNWFKRKRLSCQLSIFINPSFSRTLVMRCVSPGE